MVKIQQLEFKYDSHQHQNTLTIPHWEILDKDRVFLTGRSGSGKSTLLNLLAGLLQPTKGTVSIHYTSINNLKQKQRNKFRAAHVGLISQQFNLIPYLSVLENVQLALSFQSNKSPDMTEEIVKLMEKLELDNDLLHKQACQLSIGQQQRVSIMRAVIHKPRLLLADEPTSALDQQAKTKFIGLLHEMAERYQFTLLFISHDISLRQYFSTTIDMESIHVV